MESKKNPDANLDRYSGIFFLIGLNLVLFLVWRLLELKTYEREDAMANAVEAIQELKEDIPITETIKNLPPPPPPSVPVVIEVVEDAVEIEETVIGSSETNQDEVVEEPILAVDDVSFAEEEETITVPFAIIEDVPVFPGCEGGSKAAQRECFQQKIQEHIAQHFNYPDLAKEMGLQGKVYVQFV
ncbi:MAG: energy transducer TonB, partial [Sinomicrobium sp.]|nr:energy transducer TonB [Sinomicrobium sp.]